MCLIILPVATATPAIPLTSSRSSSVTFPTEYVPGGPYPPPFPSMVILLVPKEANCSLIAVLSPCARLISATTAAMPMNMPIMVSQLLSFLWNMLLTANLATSPINQHHLRRKTSKKQKKEKSGKPISYFPCFLFFLLMNQYAAPAASTTTTSIVHPAPPELPLVP